MLHGVRFVFFTLCLYLGTHLFVFSVLPVALLISYLRPREIPALKRWFVRCVFAIVGKQVQVSGMENFEPQRAYVIIANYPSGYAGFALVGAFPQAVLVAHAFLKRIPLLGQVLQQLGTVFVRSGKNGRGKQAFELELTGGRAVTSAIILPEGGRTPDGRIHRFRRGFLYLLRRTSYDLLPVTLNGLYTLKPARRFYVDPRARPELVIHPAVSAAAIRQVSDSALLAMAQHIILSKYSP